ncbi:MAG: sigma-54 dependent transcriptional regulator [Rhodocyclaceae bacterium]|nr:sigma-54 dependent transcriptional regulator [Rhodocyclaceae bacterium]
MSPNKLRLCLIEDDEIMGESLAERLQLEGFEVDWCQTLKAASQHIDTHRYNLIVSDMRLPDGNGGDFFLDLIGKDTRLPPFLFMTAYGSIDRAVELLKRGAADYVTKPFDPEIMVAKIKELAKAYGPSDDVTSDALGVSSAMRRIAQSLPKLAQHTAALLLTGDSGVGKEHVARLFHHYATPTAPFIAVNCAAIPETLMESELFGYEKGAFTGAMKQKRGVFEMAHGGVLFLDEIGEMPLSMQVKLLRVLQEHTLTRLGGETLIHVDFRLICATHRDIKAMVEAKQFREDLYYRIHVIHLRIPPLKERPDDIRWFVRHFIETFNQAHPVERRYLDSRTEQALLNYAWPGNVRELKHAVERACILSPGPHLTAEAFFGDSLEATASEITPSQSLSDYLMACERDYLQMSLDKNEGHMTRTAGTLGITRKTLWEKMRKLNMKQEDTQPL